MSMKRNAAWAALAVAMSAGSAHAGQCRDPWITQAIQEVTGRQPNGSYESGECTYTQYGGGHWNSYPELKGYVRQRLGLSLGVSRGDFGRMSLGQYNALPKQSYNGRLWAYYNGRWMQVVAQGGGNMRLIGQDSAGIIIDNGAN